MTQPTTARELAQEARDGLDDISLAVDANTGAVVLELGSRRLAIADVVDTFGPMVSSWGWSWTAYEHDGAEWIDVEADGASLPGIEYARKALRLWASEARAQAVAL